MAIDEHASLRRAESAPPPSLPSLGVRLALANTNVVGGRRLVDAEQRIAHPWVHSEPKSFDDQDSSLLAGPCCSTATSDAAAAFALTLEGSGSTRRAPVLTI